jgi:site-specific recombinase XerC
MPQPSAGTGRHRLRRKVDPVTRRRSGNPNPRGRLERAEGLFRLRPGLTAPGDLVFADALDLVTADWARQVGNGTISDTLIRTYSGYLRRLTGVLVRFGKDDVRDIDANTVLVWMKMPKPDGQTPARNVMAVRRSAARSFFQTAFCLGITDTNPAKAIDLPDRTERYVHPLTDDQIRQLQRTARTSVTDSRRPAALALVMSGAATAELATVTLADVDLPNSRVWVHDGGYRYRDRWLPLIDDWCVDAITRRLTALPTDPHYRTSETDRFLVFRSATPDRDSVRARSAMADLLTTLLKDSGVYNPGVNRAESVREWCARRVYAQTGSVEQVAVRLGMASLDAAAHLLGLDWATDLSTEPPPAHRLTGSQQ